MPTICQCQRDKWEKKNASTLPLHLKRRLYLLDDAQFIYLMRAFATRKYRVKKALSKLSERKRQPRTKPVHTFMPSAAIEAILNKMVTSGKLRI